MIRNRREPGWFRERNEARAVPERNDLGGDAIRFAVRDGYVIANRESMSGIGYSMASHEDTTVRNRRSVAPDASDHVRQREAVVGFSNDEPAPHGAMRSTVPDSPSTRTVSPSRMLSQAPATPVTTGKAKSRATRALDENGVPISETAAHAR